MCSLLLTRRVELALTETTREATAPYWVSSSLVSVAVTEKTVAVALERRRYPL